MKRLIVITSPQLIENEAELLVTALDAGADYLHLRKPHSTCSEVAKLIDSIPCKYHPQIVLHDHHSLAEN
ncbi:MAG: thiamine phosphate synthase, partial [Bacteroidales bacterium]|nr:thiamine phosphate synthase [Bacteroidales bacterium]